MTDATKKVFISYSWAVQERVIELAERLIANGIDVILDVYDLKEGQDKYAFMEQSVNDPVVDRVLIICDKTYTEKANSRNGGVGDETAIISPDIYGQVKQEKFIPIIFEVDEEGKAYCPSYIKSRIYIDLSSEDDRYEIECEKLIRNIYEKPLCKKPAIGVKPEWLENDTVDLSSIRDLIKQVRGYAGGNKSKADFLLRRAADEFVEAAKQYTLPKDKPKDDGLLQVIDQLKGYRDLFIDFCEASVYSAMPVSETIASIIERLYNELHDARERGSYGDTDFEQYDFLIWELFISITATMLHYEKYAELYDLLTHTYFLRINYLDSNVHACNYSEFRPHIRTIEEVCKPKSAEPMLYTLTGKILVEREKKPLLTRESISNADIVLYQLYPLFKLSTTGNDQWFPTSFIYHRESQTMWQKLKSKENCLKIAPLFGVHTIEELKSIIFGAEPIEKSRYGHSFESAPYIPNCIKIEEIGSLK